MLNFMRMMEDKNKQLMLGIIRMCESRGLEIVDFWINESYCQFKLKWKKNV